MRTLLAYSFLRGAQGRRGARGRQQRRCGRRATSGAAGTPARSKCSGSQHPVATPRSRSPPARSGPPSGPERRARRLAAEERLRRHSDACHTPPVSPRFWPPGARRRAPHEGWALGAGIAWRRRGAPRARDRARAHLHCAPAHAQGGRVRRLLKPEQVVCQVAKAVARGLPKTTLSPATAHWPQCAAL